VSTPEPLDRLFRREFDAHADDYDPWLYRYCGRLANSDEVARYRTHLVGLLEFGRVDPRGVTALDAGCGFGFTLLLLRWLVGADVHGVDISERMLRTVREYLPLLSAEFKDAIHVAQANVDQLPYEEGSFDLVLSVEAISHYRDVDAFIREAARVLHPGGVLLIHDHNNARNPRPGARRGHSGRSSRRGCRASRARDASATAPTAFAGRRSSGGRSPSGRSSQHSGARQVKRRSWAWLYTPAVVAAPYVHPQAIVETNDIGPDTRIWAFAHVMPEARVGAECNVCDHTYIDNGVVVGDRVTIKSGVYLWEGMVVEDGVFLGPQATFTNDRFPRSRQPWTCEGIVIRRGATVGAGAVVLPGTTIGERAMVGAGAVVTEDVEPDTVVAGNPARIVRRLEPPG
jgi:acetyltransferase-like isoleucine patch superfamily enzyme/ubiquinone/menaquinone biosynthesis C-methylase UbiE